MDREMPYGATAEWKMKISCLLAHDYGQIVSGLCPFNKNFHLKWLTMSACFLVMIGHNLTTSDIYPEMFFVGICVCIIRKQRVLEGKRMSELWSIARQMQRVKNQRIKKGDRKQEKKKEIFLVSRESKEKGSKNN